MVSLVTFLDNLLYFSDILSLTKRQVPVFLKSDITAMDALCEAFEYKLFSCRNFGSA
jgi:hypothetical protein